jgi:uncharacterized membrane protein
MISLPTPFLRGLCVVTTGAVLTLSHIAFAAAAGQPVKVARAAALSQSADADVTGSIAPAWDLADNCYFEFVHERSARGKTVTRRVHECD